jgi:hypothetical protein
MKMRRMMGKGSPVRPIARKLVEAGFHTPRLVKHATDDELLAVEGIGPGTLKHIREIFPKVG